MGLVHGVDVHSFFRSPTYTAQPHSMKLASVFFGIATAGGTLNYQKLAPTREKADKVVDVRLAAAMTADANDSFGGGVRLPITMPHLGLKRLRRPSLRSTPPMMSAIHLKPAS